MSVEVKRYFVEGPDWELIEGEIGELVGYEDYDALLAERDALKKDAERYRWLRSAKDWPDLGMTPDSCDAAIDQAMQGEQP